MLQTNIAYIMGGFEDITKELKSTSLLQKDETIIEGFYPIRINSDFYYCLLTNLNFILSKKEPRRKFYTSELIPLNQIKTISLTRFRDRLDLIQYAIMLLLGLIFIPLALSIQSFELMINGFKPLELVAIMLWIAFFAIVIRFSIAVNRFFKGENIIQLNTPNKILKLQGYFPFFKMAPIFLFKGFEVDLNLESNIKSIDELYNNLLIHIKK